MEDKNLMESHPEWSILIGKYLPWVNTFKVWVLLLLGVFAYGSFWPGLSLNILAEQTMLIGPKVWDEPWRLVTYMLMHGSWLHLLMNTLAYYQLAKFTETLYGTLRFQAIFIISGIFGGVASCWWNPYVNTVGASGAIMGLMGAILAYTVVLRHHLPADLKSQMVRDVIITCALTACLGITIPNIDNAAHLGGFIAGFIVGLTMAPRPNDNTSKLIIRFIFLSIAISITAFVAIPYNEQVDKTYAADKQFEETLNYINSEEERLNIKHQELIGKAEKTDFELWEKEYSAEIIKPLSDITKMVENIHLYPDSKKKIEYSVLSRYVALKQKEAETVTEWVRTRDLKMMEMLPKYNEEYETLLKTLKAIK